MRKAREREFNRKKEEEREEREKDKISDPRH